MDINYKLHSYIAAQVGNAVPHSFPEMLPILCMHALNICNVLSRRMGCMKAQAGQRPRRQMV